MKMRPDRGIVIAIMLAVASLPLNAQSTATQAVTLEVKPISRIAVSGNPQSLFISDFTPGSGVASVSDQSTSYGITTNLSSMKIVASIDAGMPAGTRLLLKLESANGLSAGTVDVSDALSPVDVVQGIDRGTEADRPISYVFIAEAEAGEVSPQSRTVTLTLTQ